MKRSWTKPEMIVLVRRKSDEIILANCRSSLGDAFGENDGCFNKRSAPPFVSMCTTRCKL